MRIRTRKKQDYRGSPLKEGDIVTFVHPLRNQLEEGVVKEFKETDVLVSHSIDGYGKYERVVSKNKIVKLN